MAIRYVRIGIFVVVRLALINTSRLEIVRNFADFACQFWGRSLVQLSMHMHWETPCSCVRLKHVIAHQTGYTQPLIVVDPI